MSKIRLCNLNFVLARSFTPFALADYRFEPIPEGQPKVSHTWTPARQASYHRVNRLNAIVHAPAREPDSIIFTGARRTRHRDCTFTDDLLALISICIGRNVSRWAQRQYPSFPIASSNCLIGVARDSNGLQKCLGISLTKIQDPAWQQTYGNGFQILELLFLSNTRTQEMRFLAYMVIWEYLYFCHHRGLPIKTLQGKALDQKISWLIGEYRLVERKYGRQTEKCGVFSCLRNQEAHGGAFHVSDLRGPLQDASPALCGKYMKLFDAMTENLVLATLGIDSDHERWAIEQLLEHGRVAAYDNDVKHGL